MGSTCGPPTRCGSGPYLGDDVRGSVKRKASLSVIALYMACRAARADVQAEGCGAEAQLLVAARIARLCVGDAPTRAVASGRGSVLCGRACQRRCGALNSLIVVACGKCWPNPDCRRAPPEPGFGAGRGVLRMGLSGVAFWSSIDRDGWRSCAVSSRRYCNGVALAASHQVTLSRRARHRSAPQVVRRWPMATAHRANACRRFARFSAFRLCCRRRVAPARCSAPGVEDQ